MECATGGFYGRRENGECGGPQIRATSLGLDDPVAQISYKSPVSAGLGRTPGPFPVCACKSPYWNKRRNGDQ